MTTKLEGRVYGLDILKTICSFLVVIIHINFPGLVGYYAIAIARIAVPVFFMITGYFYVITEAKCRQLDEIRKIFLLAITSTVLYLIKDVIFEASYGKSVGTIILEKFGKTQMIEWVLLNNPPDGGHLWYLYSLLYCLIVVYLLKKLIPGKADIILMIAMPILLCTDLAFGKYSLVLMHREFSYLYVRNFLCVALPYFTIGYLLRKNNRIIEIIGTKPILNCLFVLLFIITTGLEKDLLNHYGLSSVREHYISSTLLSVALFILFVSHFWDGRLRIANYIGKNYSLYIYILHPIVIDLFMRSLPYLPNVMSVIYSNIAPIIIYILAVFVSALIVYIRRIVKRVV